MHRENSYFFYFSLIFSLLIVDFNEKFEERKPLMKFIKDYFPKKNSFIQKEQLTGFYFFFSQFKRDQTNTIQFI